MISQTLSPEGALTLHGFKLNRALSRERGNVVQPSSDNIAIFGPYRRLAPGFYRVAMMYEIKGSEQPARHSGKLSLDIFSLARNAVVAEVHSEYCPIAGDEMSPRALMTSFDWGAAEAAGLIEIRLYQRSTAALKVLGVRLEKRAG